jgi:homocysteine S-methyltransferase
MAQHVGGSRLHGAKDSASGKTVEPGERLIDAISELKGGNRRGPIYNDRLQALLINCSTPKATTSALQEIKEDGILESINKRRRTPLYQGVYANAEEHIENGLYQRSPFYSEKNYAKDALDWIENGARIVGGCCGTTPRDIAFLHSVLVAKGYRR